MRTNKITILLGNRATGKTVYGKTLIKAALDSGRSALIVDTFDHPSYSPVERIRPDQIPLIEPGELFRCFGANTDEILHECVNYYNGLLVLEDATKYIANTIGDDVKAILFDSKQKNVDVLLMFHSWTACPPSVFRIADIVAIKKTGDSCEIRKKDCPNFAEVQRAWEKVETSKDRYITEIVYLQ